MQAALRRLVRFCASGNLSRLLVLLIAPFFGLPLLPPLQLLWLSLVTDGLLGLGMSLEQPQAVMDRPPERWDFTRDLGFQVIGISLLTAALGAVAFFGGRAEWGSVIFTFLAFAQISHFLVFRPLRMPLLSLGLLALVFALQLAALYFSPLAHFLGLAPLSPFDLSLALMGGVLVFAALESIRRALRKMEALPQRA